jgi:membrane protein
LFEQAWELKPLGVRNTGNGLLWIAGLVAYVSLSGWVHNFIDASKVGIAATTLLLPVTFAFLVWSGWVLTARRLPRRGLVPFGVVGAAAISAGSICVSIYVPHLFSSYATRYGVIGAVFAMITALFIMMVAIVAAAAAGREVHDELERIRAGERPADDEVRREWDALIAEARTRWETIRRRKSRDPTSP